MVRCVGLVVTGEGYCEWSCSCRRGLGLLFTRLVVWGDLHCLSGNINLRHIRGIVNLDLGIGECSFNLFTDPRFLGSV